jgi:glycosyltransferase involved in cell wall biosynthesis
MKELISIIIPTLNEEKNLSIVLKEVKGIMKKRKWKHEIIVVDGYSKDRSVKIAKKSRAKVLFDNVGKGSALRKGMKAAKGDIIVIMDADCSHRGMELGLLIEGIKSGYDICMGSRFIQGGGTEDMPWYRKLGNKFFVFLVNLLWNMEYSDLCYGYRSFRKSCIKKLVLRANGFGIEAEISIKAAKKKLRVLEVPSFEKKRLHGKGGLRTFRDGWNILKTIISELGK